MLLGLTLSACSGDGDPTGSTSLPGGTGEGPVPTMSFQAAGALLHVWGSDAKEGGFVNGFYDPASGGVVEVPESSSFFWSKATDDTGKLLPYPKYGNIGARLPNGTVLYAHLGVWHVEQGQGWIRGAWGAVEVDVFGIDDCTDADVVIEN